MTIFDGGSSNSDVIAKKCGEIAGMQILSSKNIVFIVFETDSSRSRKGFKLEYNTIPKNDLA